MRRMKASGAEGQAAARLNELPMLARGSDVVFARARRPCVKTQRCFELKAKRRNGNKSHTDARIVPVAVKVLARVP